MNGDRTLLITVFTSMVIVCGVLVWFEIPLILLRSFERLKSMKFLADFYHGDLKEVNRLSFFVSSHERQTLILQRWLSSHLDSTTLAILERNMGYPFDPSSAFDHNLTLAEKKRRRIPAGYERLWVMTGVRNAMEERSNAKERAGNPVA